MTHRQPQHQLRQRSQPEPWPWPLDLTAYDRHPVLSHAELTELDRIALQSGQVHQKSKRILHRLALPINDVLMYLQTSYDTACSTIRLLFIQMQRRRLAFWGWTDQDWLDLLCSTSEEFSREYGFRTHVRHSPRSSLSALVYLLCPHISIDPLLAKEASRLARKVFGEEAIELASERILTVLRGWGYQQKTGELTTCVNYLLLKSHSPFLEHVTEELLQEAQRSSIHTVGLYLFQVSRALTGLGIIPKPLPGPSAPREIHTNSDESVSREWVSWCERWRSHATYQKKMGIFYALLSVGRWLQVTHPEITTPAQWSYELAIEFIAAVNEMKVGEWANPALRERLFAADHMGQPLRPYSKNRLIKAVRTFFRDCQEWEWIPRLFNPARALRTPTSLRRLIGPNPRVIDKDLWAKILWAAMNLQLADLPGGKKPTDPPVYPLEMVRAVAVVWCFTALRSNEITRLRVGCIRWQREDVMIPETGEILPKDATCFLDVPVNKTSPAFTKPVHPLVGKRVNEWEQVRRPEQPRAVDQKTGEAVQFLFSCRGRRISQNYLNRHLIPILCRKAGIPEQDSRGQITSHRARATIASLLYNAREPLSIFELKEFLGHKQLSSTQSYLLVDPTKLASKVAKTGYLEQNLATIEVLLDQEAVLSGAAARGEPWKYYDLGHGYCANTSWAECKHRMACARCPFYRPKHSSKEQFIEGLSNLVRMLEYVQLTEDEKALVTEGIELHQALIEKLADVPTPAGPTPRELEAERQSETRIIPLKAVRRRKPTNR